MMIPQKLLKQTEGTGDIFQDYQTQNKEVKPQAPSSVDSSSLLKAIESSQVPFVSSETRHIEIVKLEKYSDSHTLEESYSFIKKKLKSDVIKVFANQIAKDHPGLIHQSNRIAHYIYKTFAQGEKKITPSNYDSEKLAMIDRKLLKKMEKRVHD
jgi:hypothetical protein